MGKALWWPSSALYRRFGPIWHWDAWAAKETGEIVHASSGWAWGYVRAAAKRDQWLASVGSSALS